MTRHQSLQATVQSQGDSKHNGISTSPIDTGFQQAGSMSGAAVDFVGRHAHSCNPGVRNCISWYLSLLE